MLATALAHLRVFYRALRASLAATAVLFRIRIIRSVRSMDASVESSSRETTGPSSVPGSVRDDQALEMFLHPYPRIEAFVRVRAAFVVFIRQITV